MFIAMLFLFCSLSLSSMFIAVKSLSIYEASYTLMPENGTCGDETPVGDTECFFDEISDDISPVDDGFLSVFEDTIFFAEMSCSGGLSYKQACSVESAARAHPERRVVVFFLGAVSASYCLKRWPIWNIAVRYNNIKLYRLNITDYVNGTAMSDYFTNGRFNSSLYQNQHISDILRLITLNKYGGVFLDLHMIVTKSLDGLSKNWLTKTETDGLSDSVMALSKYGYGQSVSYDLLRYYSTEYRPDSEFFFVSVLHSILHTICTSKILQSINTRDCGGLAVYDKAVFFPVQSEHYGKFFEKYNKKDWDEDNYAFYVWDNVAHSLPLDRNTLFETLMEKHCPYIYETISNSNNVK